jgi:hypothetical protein
MLIYTNLSLRSRRLVRVGLRREGVVEETPAQMAMTNVFLTEKTSA